MQVAPVGSGTSPNASSGAGQATSAFGLSFDSLLKIILTQLTYQDPLKPMDNFQFVSQLAQFSQIQQGQATNDNLEALISAQATSQATGILGRIVDVPTNATTMISGKVTAVSFQVNAAPTVTIESADGQTHTSVPINSISTVR